MRRVVLVALLALSLLAGCSCDEDPAPTTPGTDEPGGRGRATPEPAPAAGSLGVVEGVIRLAEGADLPAYTVAELGRGPGRPDIPASCTPPQETDTRPVGRTADGLLTGVMVTATGDRQHFHDALPAHAPQEHIVAIEDCRLSPRLLVATRGDTLRLQNHTPYPFLPTFGGGNLMQALLEGQERVLPLDRGGVQAVQCAFAAPCGRTDVVVVYHPVHTLTGADGHFRLENVPTGREVQIHAWHPLFQDAQAVTTVPEGGRAQVEITLTPRATPAAPPPAPEGDGGPVENQPGLF